MKDRNCFCVITIILYYIISSTCTVLDSCRLNPCKYGVCFNNGSDYVCACPKGTKFDTDAEDVQLCNDIDECAIRPKICLKHTICINLFAKFECRCKDGFEKTNQYNCKDIDECEWNDTCPLENQKCVNNVGHFQCRCKKGFVFEPNFKVCTDLHKKTTKNSLKTKMPEACRYFQCPKYSYCKKRNNKAVCVCKPGFRPNVETCEDVDECMNVTCENEALHCVNTVGSFACECPDGFQFNYTTSVCNDIDECATCGGGKYCNLQGCKGIRYYVCVNTVGSYMCTPTCPAGHSYNGTAKKCQDVDECEDKLCLNHGVCYNTHGSYICSCPNGFYPSTECIDIDECQLEICPALSYCLNKPGRYSCLCFPGYKYVNQTNSCEDIDECILINQCGYNFDCTNTIGSFVCTCSSWYKNATECIGNKTDKLLLSEYKHKVSTIILIVLAVIFILIVSFLLMKVV